jgi:hypothetical protein
VSEFIINENKQLSISENERFINLLGVKKENLFGRYLEISNKD